MKWIEWVEPFGPNSEPVYMRVEAATAIAAMRASHPCTYDPGSVGDEQALGDFIALHWASEREDLSCPTNPLHGVCIESPRPSQGEKWGRLTENEAHGVATLTALPGLESKQDDRSQTTGSVGRLHVSPNAQADREGASREAAE